MRSRKPELDGLHVLIVEDEPEMREALVLLLRLFGASVTAVASAREGQEALVRVKPDVLLSDLSMPGEDGYEFIRKVRALPPERGGRVPAAAVTARTSPEDRREALAAGFQAHVAKLLAGDTLADVVMRLAGRAEAPPSSSAVADDRPSRASSALAGPHHIRHTPPAGSRLRPRKGLRPLWAGWSSAPARGVAR